MYWAELGRKKWLEKIDRENPTRADISRLLNISSMNFHHKKEPEAFDKWIRGIIRRSGPKWVYDNRDRIKTDYVSKIKPGWLSQWSYEDREQRRKAARKKEGTGSSAEGTSPPPQRPKPPQPPKPKRGFLTYKSSSPRSHGLISKALWRLG